MLTDIVFWALVFIAGSLFVVGTVGRLVGEGAGQAVVAAGEGELEDEPLHPGGYYEIAFWLGLALCLYLFFAPLVFSRGAAVSFLLVLYAMVCFGFGALAVFFRLALMAGVSFSAAIFFVVLLANT